MSFYEIENVLSVALLFPEDDWPLVNLCRSKHLHLNATLFPQRNQYSYTQTGIIKKAASETYAGPSYGFLKTHEHFEEKCYSQCISI